MLSANGHAWFWCGNLIKNAISLITDLTKSLWIQKKMNDGHITLGYMLMHMVFCHQIMHEAGKLKGIMYFKWSQL